MPHLEDLANELLYTIFADEVLSLIDLLMIALTNKRLNMIVIPSIYSRFSGSSGFDNFSTVVRDRGYGKFVRVIEISVSETINPLKILLGCPTLQLKILRLSDCSGDNLDALSQTLHSRNPGIQIASLDIRALPGRDCTGKKNGVLALLSNLGSLRGLTTLSFPEFRTVGTQEILNALHSPTLVTLELRNPDTCCPHLVENELPSLRSIILSYNFPHRQMLCILRHPMERMWKAWNMMMQRNVSLSLTHRTRRRDYFVILVQIILKYARLNRLDPVPLTRWLLSSPSQNGLKQPGIQKFPSVDRDTFLRIIADVFPIYKLTIKVDQSDNIIHLPHSITTLYIDIAEPISPQLLPTLINSLSRLKTMEIRLICGYDPDIGLGSRASCTIFPFHVPQFIVSAAQRKINSIDISKNGENIIWHISMEKVADHSVPEAISLDNEIQSCSWYDEMRGWVLERSEVEFNVKLIRKS